MNWLLHGVIGGLLIAATGCSPSPAAVQPVFVTEHGLGPDKWATAWLLTQRVVPGAKLTVVAPHQPLPSGTAFDAPGAELQRTGNRSAFEMAVQVYGLEDPDVRQLAQIVHDIEVNFWAPEKVADASLVEQGFRELQRGQPHAEVSPACYVAFFESVYRALQVKRAKGLDMSLDSLATDCHSSLAMVQGDQLVPEVPIPGLLAEMQRGKSVVFVDVREPDEFEEAHIPGALNITLRDLDQDAVYRVQHADYVVAYCVKDFRGFEMARALRREGIQNAVILEPYGMKGWLSQGLPMAGSRAMAEGDARDRLADCLSSPSLCSIQTRNQAQN